MAVATLTDSQVNLLERFDPALKAAGLATIAANLISEANASVKVKVVAGTNASALAGISDAATVLAVLAITTSTGAAAAKLLQAVTTDYTVSGGVITTVGDKSLLTLIVIYRT